jgi:ribosomal protein S18 acetylase RimI-like enzyme
MILFSCSLPIKRPQPVGGVSVERTSASTLPKDEYTRSFGVQNPTVRMQQLAALFAAGGELWLARLDGELAGFGWTIQGRTIEPHFFPLQPDEVHFFDFYVSPEFRGRRINVALMTEVLAQLDGAIIRRAHLECAAWNAAQLHSLDKSLFRRYATASKLTFLGRALVIWH